MKWKWRLTAYYNNTVLFPKLPDTIALQTLHASDVSKDMELEAYAKRTDIQFPVVVENLEDD